MTGRPWSSSTTLSFTETATFLVLQQLKCAVLRRGRTCALSFTLIQHVFYYTEGSAVTGTHATAHRKLQVVEGTILLFASSRRVSSIVRSHSRSQSNVGQVCVL
jgi:hypothetical protein